MTPILAALLMFANAAQASGNGVGNGGKLLHCPARAIPYELLDVFEGRELYAEKPLPCPPGPYGQCLRARLTPLREKFPVTTDKLLGALARFPAEALFLHGTSLPDSGDDEHLFLPSGCALEQLALATDGQNLPPGKKFVVNADLWDQLSPGDQAAAALHELLQAERQTGLGQSTPMVRRVVMGYVTGSVADMTEQQFADFNAQNGKTWFSVKRGALHWLVQNNHFMTNGHNLAGFTDGRLTRLRNDLSFVGSITHGDLEVSNYGTWNYGGDGKVDITVGRDFLRFTKTSPLTLTTADRSRTLGSFSAVTRVDQTVICAQAFEPAAGEQNPIPSEGCWAWESFAN